MSRSHPMREGLVYYHRRFEILTSTGMPRPDRSEPIPRLAPSPARRAFPGGNQLDRRVETT